MGRKASGFAVALGLTAAFVVAAPVAATATDLGKAGGFSYAKATEKVAANKTSGTVFAKCPGETESLGGGSSLSRDADGIYVSESSGRDPDGWFTSAHHEPGPGFKVTSWVICAKGEGVKRYRDNATAGEGNPFYHSVSCEQGYPVSGGNHTQGPVENWVLSQIWPFSASGWATTVANFGPTADLTAEVTCIEAGTYNSMIETYSSNASIDEHALGCDNGQSVMGGGTVSDGFGDETHILESRPIDGLADNDKVPDDGWRATNYNDANETRNYEIYASCR